MTMEITTFLSRARARQIIWHHLESGTRGTMEFFTWEIKMPIHHEENIRMVETFLDRLEVIGLVRP